ncbi:hypothetical protein L2D14_07470 [Thalassospiraceae bacterium LMO-JJ14]|nr:hypothetical protein L2D14_07470 [Thalassospiraceae bacterium LMO-JJ14]
MLGFSKKERAAKELLSAFDVILIGRKDDKTSILKSLQGKMPALSESVMSGINPYELAAKCVQDDILATLKKSSQEERVEMLKYISDNNFKDQPHIFELISHVNYCLIILEDETKPLIPIGSAEGFLVTICKWFGSNDKLLHRVVTYFQDSTQNHRYHLQQNRKRNERKFR